ncbi:MAG TPA: hypothetical protein G4O08_04820 [Anaerolineae bacterium]|nr:hypothetical protein [Anaerolineae bacterium]
MDGTARYRIKVVGRLNGRWEDWFDHIHITHEKGKGGATLTLLESGEIDQAGLHGILKRLRDLNLPLHCVERIDETAAGSIDGDG